MSQLTLLYSPFPTLETAQSAANALLQARHVACCNLLPGAESHYWWDGKLTQSTEVILIAKTTAAQAAAARKTLEKHHPYECPAILTINAESNPEYAAWAASQINP